MAVLVWLVRSMLPLAWCLEMARLTTRGDERGRRAGSGWSGEDGLADEVDEVDGGFGDGGGSVDELVSGGVQGDREAEPIWWGVAVGQCGVGDGGSQGLVGDQQCPDFLGDPGWGAGAEDTSAPMVDFSSM